jgi:hypothetical protein
MNMLFMKQAFPEWAIWRILNAQPLPAYLCSPEGITLKFSYPLFLGSEELDFEFFGIPDLSDEQLSLIRLMETRNVQSRHEIPDRGWFVSARQWTVRTQERAMEQIRAWSQKPPALPAESDTEFEAEMIDFLQAIRPFEGWAVCFSEADIPRDDESMEALLARLGASFSLPMTRPALAPLRASTAEALELVLPEGRRGTPWKVVAAMVQERLGRPVSSKTCMRAASELGPSWTGT